MLKGKHIVLGITGSIAAYKACTLVRLLIKAGAEVQVVMTPAAKEFITPLTLSTLSRNAVVSEFFDRRDGSWHSHVDLGLWADAMVIAPATAATWRGRQYADYDLSVDEGSCLCGSGDGFGYVPPPLHTSQFGHLA